LCGRFVQFNSLRNLETAFPNASIVAEVISNMPLSSITPSGYRVEEARYYIRQTASRLKTVYLHLLEGAPRPDSAEENKVRKTLASLVADFINSRHSTHPPTN